MPLLQDILQRSLMHCIRIPYSVSSQSIWEYWCPPSGCWNSPVGYLPIPFISGQLFSWVSSKGKGELNSETHFVQGGTCAQRTGREEWVSLGALPWYVQSLFVIDEVPEKLTACLSWHFGGMTAQKSSRRVCPNSPNAVTKHVFAGSSLDGAPAPCGGHSCSFVFTRETRCVTHALLAELWGPKQLLRTLWASVQAQTAGGIETNVGGIPGHYSIVFCRWVVTK